MGWICGLDGCVLCVAGRMRGLALVLVLSGLALTTVSSELYSHDTDAVATPYGRVHE